MGRNRRPESGRKSRDKCAIPYCWASAFVGIKFCPDFGPPFVPENCRFERPAWSPSESPYLFGRAPDGAQPRPGLSLLGSASARTEAKRLGDKSAPGPAKTDSPGRLVAPISCPDSGPHSNYLLLTWALFRARILGAKLGPQNSPGDSLLACPGVDFVAVRLRLCPRQGGVKQGRARAGLGQGRGPAENGSISSHTCRKNGRSK